MALIARYTGWKEHFIIWDLSLHRAHAYAHAFMRMNNIKTALVNRGAQIGSDPLREKFDNLFAARNSKTAPNR